MRAPFSADGRESLLREYWSMRSGFDEVEALLTGLSGFTRGRLHRHQALYLDRATQLREEYAACVPRVGLSRCPFSGAAVHHSLDTFGLDGLWWNHDAPVRGDEDVPPTFFALTGAVRLGDRVERAPFLCLPGPEAPYVLPRLLRHPTVRAVVSAIAVDGHQAYPIVYFADPVPSDLPRVNAWGAHRYVFADERGERRWDDQPLLPWELDFDLAPWVAQGKLRWIAPSDTSLALRDGLEECPYLGLSGRRELAHIYDGQVQWIGLPPEFSS